MARGLDHSVRSSNSVHEVRHTRRCSVDGRGPARGICAGTRRRLVARPGVCDRKTTFEDMLRPPALFTFRMASEPESPEPPELLRVFLEAQSLLLGVIRRRGIPRDALRDVLHDALATLLSNGQERRLELEKPLGLVIAHCRSSSTAYRRQHRAEFGAGSVVEALASSNPSNAREASSTLGRIETLVGSWPQLEQEVFFRTFVDEQADAQIAEDLGKSLQYIRQVRCALRQRLQEALTDDTLERSRASVAARR
jgi:DNA-directed RNA polymerase specialized sigma24 family protein